MKIQNLMKSKYFVLAAVILVVFMMAGCKGDTGATGDTGPAGAAGPQGPHGTYASSTCTDCHHMSNETVNSIEPYRLSGLATGGTATTGNPVVATVKSVFSNGTYTVNATGYYWQYMDGLAATASSVVTGTTLTITVTAGQDFRAALVANMNLPDRTMVVPVNGFGKELAQNAEYTVYAFGDDGKIYYDIAKIVAKENNVATYAPVLTTGINNVPINLPVLLNAEGTGPYTWSIVSSPSLTTNFDNNAVKNPYIIPDAVGQYVLNVVTTPTGTTNPVTDVLTIYAGDWRGAITGVDMNNLTAEGADYGTLVPDATCTGCHNDSTAPDKFSTWKSSGHATRFEGGLNEGGHYGPSCFSCHTVGYVSTTKNNGGFGDQVNYSAFIADTTMFATTADSTRYSRMSSPTGSYYALFRETGIQCENCHGPQNKNTTGRASGDFSAAHNTTSNGAGPRVSLASDVCGVCHGSPQHHGRFQEWQGSGHGNFELAIGEGTSANCAGCHSAQGFMIWLPRLLAGNPLRSIPSGSITWTAATVQPQTCAVCHDPHDEGMTTGLETDAQPRITDNVPKLPAGFAATGVGKGAICMICHNTRNGGSGTDSYLHEDNDPKFGMLTSYAAPHAPAQTDVLMGHNAYFMGDSSVSTATDTTAAYRSPHAGITDTCVNCHMVKTTPPQEFSDYENTNHTFKASMEICNDCHGTDPGLGVKTQVDTQTFLNQVLTAIQSAVISQATGTYAGNIATATLTTSHGSPVLNLTFLDATPAADGVSVNTVVPINTDAGQLLAKGIWNYFLINNDSSLGVHNPNFIRTVLGNTYAKIGELQ